MTLAKSKGVWGILIAASLLAQDAGKPPAVPTVEQQLAETKQEIVVLNRKVQIYEQGLAACQDAQIDAQARRQAQQQKPGPVK